MLLLFLLFDKFNFVRVIAATAVAVKKGKKGKNGRICFICSIFSLIKLRTLKMSHYYVDDIHFPIFRRRKLCYTRWKMMMFGYNREFIQGSHNLKRN